MSIPNLKKTMLEVYEGDTKDARPGFFTSFFRTKPEYFTDSQRINIDIIRSAHKLAPVVTALGGNSVKVSNSVFNGIEVTPPVYLMEKPVDLYELLQRQPGETEWTKRSASWSAQVAQKIRNGKNQITDMIMRSVEYQAAQVLQTGTITLTDENGNNAYTLNFGKSSSQIVTPTTKWDANGGNPEADIDSLAQAIADEAHVTATTLIFGRKAWDAFMKNDKIKALIQKDNYNMGAFSNAVRGHGEIYKGFINLGSFRFDLYVYNASYEAFTTETITRYLDEKNVLVLPNEEDLDFRLVHAVYPMLPSENRFSNLVPEEVIVDGKMRFYNKVFGDDRSNAISVQTASRPLCIPVSLDNWGVLTAVCN